MHRSLWILFLALILEKPLWAQNELPLSTYLQKIERQNSGFRSLSKSEEATAAAQADAEILTDPALFSDVTIAEDKRPLLTPQFNGTTRRARTVKLGLQQQWSFGLQNRVYVISDYQGISGAVAMQDPSMDIENRGAAVELELPLIKNGLGLQVRLQREALQASAEGQKNLANFDKARLRAEAQVLYIRLVQAQEHLAVHQELLRQGETLVTWVSGQVKDRLLEAVHLAQVQVALEARRLGLESRRLQLETTKMQFYAAIEEKTPFALPRLETLNRLESSITMPRNLSQRLDLKGRQNQVDAERAQLALEREAYRPDLSFRAQYHAFTKVSDQNDTARCDDPWKCSSSAIGLVFSMPLDRAVARRATEGRQAQVEARVLELARAQIEAERDRRQIMEQINRLFDHQRILNKLISQQDERLRLERARQQRGRATTFDLIQAEQELTESREQLITLRSQRLELLTQLKLYEVAP
jgi:outer membrane protein TolC